MINQCPSHLTDHLRVDQFAACREEDVTQYKESHKVKNGGTTWGNGGIEAEIAISQKFASL